MEFFDRDSSNDTKMVAIIMGALTTMTAIVCYTAIVMD